MRVGFDLDGCLFNFGESVKSYLEATGLGHLWKSGPTPTPYWEFYKDWGWDFPRFAELCSDGVEAGYIFRGNVRPHAINAVWAVKSAGHEIIIITDRSFGKTPRSSHRATIEWWSDYGFPEYDEIHFSSDKTCVPTDIFVEDKLQNYDALMEAGTECWLINRPWNLEKDKRNRIHDIIDYPAKVHRKQTEQTNASSNITVQKMTSR